MIRLHILLSIIAVVLLTVARVHAWTWFPDPQRGAALEARWNRYKAIPYKTLAAVEQVCGVLGQATCSKTFGRPPDAETESCDRSCCHAGFLTGYCQGRVDVGVKIIADPSQSGQVEYKPTINFGSGCRCSDDLRDAKCGPDGSFLGIRCPFDKSACARKCCREGKSGGYCGGFLGFKCKCN